MSAAIRQSIAPTYDHRETGDRFTVETRLDDRRIDLTPIRDPFVNPRTAGVRRLSGFGRWRTST